VRVSDGHLVGVGLGVRGGGDVVDLHEREGRHGDRDGVLCGDEAEGVKGGEQEGLPDDAGRGALLTEMVLQLCPFPLVLNHKYILPPQHHLQHDHPHPPDIVARLPPKPMTRKSMAAAAAAAAAFSRLIEGVCNRLRWPVVVCFFCGRGGDGVWVEVGNGERENALKRRSTAPISDSQVDGE